MSQTVRLLRVYCSPECYASIVILISHSDVKEKEDALKDMGDDEG